MNSVDNEFNDFENILKNGKFAFMKFGNFVDAMKIYSGKIKLNLPLVNNKKGKLFLNFYFNLFLFIGQPNVLIGKLLKDYLEQN